jgi:rare lipoprotein A (peptidoglycan hydrolase)
MQCTTGKKDFKTFRLAFFVFFLFLGCSGVDSRQGYERSAHTRHQTQKANEVRGNSFRGEISFYGPRFHGRKTANGETYDQNALTCAHKTLPFHTLVEVTNLQNQKKVTLRVNDRGPYSGNRVLDVSVAAAKQLDMIQSGVTQAHIRIVRLGE